MSTVQKAVIITGASQGMGAALVEAYRGLGYGVVATSRSIKPTKDDQILAVPGDITDGKTAERAVSEGVARFGRIDTLINNAGVFIAKPFTRYTEADYAAVLGRQPHGLLLHHATRNRGDGEAAKWPRRADHDEPGRTRELQCAVRTRLADQGRLECCDQVAGDRVCKARHQSECGGARRH